MKKIYSLFSVLSIIGFGFSQTILNQPETTSRTVQDPQTVILLPGFYANSATVSPFIAKIGTPSDAPANPTDSEAGSGNLSGTIGSNSFHDTQGNIEVNGGGQLQFTLPIALPPGVKSVAPQINLVYTSGSGNGIAGYGWNLSGITSISRVGKTIEKDGEVKGIQLDNTDYYSFNGQRLILKSGEYGKDGAEYVTEKYSNVKIKSLGSYTNSGTTSSNWQVVGPAQFEITFEDGSQAWYGAYKAGFRDNPRVTTPLEYNIVKWKDAQGNYITYNYAQTDNVVVISSIQWGGNETLGKSHFNEIDFNYITRDFKEQSYVNGAQFIQDNLLKDITVYSNGNQFKKYVIDYFKNGTNYQFANKITEYNANNEPANPVTFEYPILAATSVVGATQSSPDSFDGVKLTGDFNGDSYIDFVMGDGTVKLGAFNDTFTTINSNLSIFNVNSILNAFVVNTVLDIDGSVHNGNAIFIYNGSNLDGYILKDNQFVKFFTKSVDDPQWCQGVSGFCRLNRHYDSADIDGDGISDIFLKVKKSSGFGGVASETEYKGDYLIDSKNANTPISKIITTGIDDNLYKEQKILDVDGDGKADVINISNTSYTVFEFVKVGANQYEKKIKYTSNLVETKDTEFPILYGDFNGDGKLDFTIPLTQGKIGKDDWRFYIGTGTGFNTFRKNDFLIYKNISTIDKGIWLNFSKTFYSIADLNKDGKSDIVQVYSYSNLLTENSRTYGVTVNTVESKGINLSDGSIDFDLKNIYKFPSSGYTISPDVYDFSIYQPLTNPIKANNNYYDVFLFRKTNVLKLKAPTSLAELSRIKSLTQAGLTTSINYLELNPDTNPNFYKKVKEEYYPYFSLQRVDQTYAVSQIQQGLRKQDFRYRGLITHLQGRGMIGFRQTARSSWYADGYENTKMWSGAEIDPLNEGVPIKEWSIKTNTESQIFPTDISENNTQLLSFKSTQYKIDKLLNGTIVDINTVSATDKPRIVTAIVPMQSKSKDFLNDVTTESTITYGDYYLPHQTVVKTNADYAINTTTLEYVHNINGSGKDYYVGRPLSKTETFYYSPTNDTKSAKQEYTYNTNNLLKTLKTYNRDESGWFLETYAYDGFGNITGKTITNSIDANTKTDQAEYDAKGRFVTKKTDNLGLETNITYNDWGQVLTQTDTFGNTLTNEYDDWGKLLKSKSNLSGYTTYTYEKFSNGDAVINEYAPDGGRVITYTNKFGQKYKSAAKAFGQSRFVASEVGYDALGRKIKESEPYFEDFDGATPSQWNTTEYDDYSRPVKATAFTGKIMQTTYGVRSVKVVETNANNRFKEQKTDPVGKVISTEDLGGIITFKYNAAGENTEADYEGNKVKTSYDAWGNKTRFEDPSNGVYEYKYLGYFGALSESKSPKGKKEYQYNNKGQLVTQKEKSDDGSSTDKVIVLSYNTKGQLLSKSGTSLGKPYSSSITYAANGRVKSTSESSNGRYFIQKDIVYDDKSRVTSYEKSLYSSGILTKVNIENVYDAWSGELYQVKDKNAGKILWELQDANAKGQVTQAKLGGVNINNSYDSNGFLNNISHISASNQATVLQVSYSFNAIKNELNSRTTGGDFNITEQFQYDDNNRLYNWTNPVTGVFTQNQKRNEYDKRGRIIKNDQLGTVKFDDAQKIYQATGMTLNAAGEQNYNNDLIQSISYNENNDPVYINGVKGDVAFEYGLTSMRQIAHYGGNFQQPTAGSRQPDSKFTKYYSEDGSYEVIRNNQTGQEKHILYIGGTPYESNIVYLKDYTESSGSYKFLHKDYLGSILAITDESGAKLEQRHYDAWGSLTHLKVGTNAVITDNQQLSTVNLLLDRGYTSHEHFAEIGIIHMNGRLYDPLLRRFLNADENIQDPNNTQNYNKYGYVMNNPLMYNDPNGEFFQFLVPILIKMAIGAIYGAAVGAGVGALAYTIKGLATGNWNVGGFLKATFGGALAGAMAGALNGLGASLFSPNSFLLNSGTWDFMSNMITGVIQDGKINLAAIGAAAIGAYAGSKLPGWKGIGEKGLSGWIKNAVGELLHSSIKSGITGAISGGFNALFRGGNVWEGVKGGFENGAYNGAGQAAFMIGTFGATYKPTDEQLKYVKKMSTETGVSYEGVKWRSEGLYKYIQPYVSKFLISLNDSRYWAVPVENFRREVTWGNNVVTFGPSGSFTDSGTFGHEFGHVIQVQRQGWANMQARGIWEQLFMKNPYSIPGTNEYNADSLLKKYGQ